MEQLRPPENYKKEDKELIQKQLEERQAVCRDLPISSKDLESLIAAVSDYDSEAQGSDVLRDLWNNPPNYTEIIPILLPYAAKYRHESFMRVMNEYKNLVASGMDNTEVIHTLSRQMREEQIADGVQMAEIGGTFIKSFFQKLGAEVDVVDASMRIVVDEGIKENILTQDNFRQFFPHEYDIVCTNNLLTTGSGIEKAAETGGIAPEDFLLMEYQLVKDYGVIINHTRKIHTIQENEFSRKYMRESYNRLHEYAKEHPKTVKLELFHNVFDPIKPLPRGEATVKVEKSEDF